MSGALSKRQQARNEKVLQELVHNISGNNLCADCHARNPVKSLSMDSWSNEQVDNMRKVGNVASNNIYNPEHRKPPVPVDVDEADSAMERFIRQKYMNNVVKASGKPKSPLLDDETPPPLPPKNSKFGFRSASSIFPLSSKSKKETKLTVTAQTVRSASPRVPNKPSKVFGATFDLDQSDEMDQKLARLRDMGFNDTKRNAVILKGVNGNLERAIEALVRLGEGGGRPSPLPTPSPREQGLRTSRSLTPLTPLSGGLGLGAGAGLSVPSRSATDRPTTPSTASTNPFDNLGPAPPQTAQSTGSLQNKNPYGSTNPFGAPVQQQTDAFSQAFQNMSLSPTQPLFPHHTGGAASQQPGPQQVIYQQHVAPSVPTSPNGYLPMAFNNMTYPQPMPGQPKQLQSQSMHSQPGGYNPFFSGASNSSSPVQQQPIQQAPQMPLSVNTAQSPASYNPFARSPTRIASPSLGQIPEQSQTSFQSPAVFQNSVVYQSPAPLQHPEPATNPFFANANQPAAQMGQQSYSNQQVTQQQFSQQQVPQQQTAQQPYGQQPFGQQSFGQQLFGQQAQQPLVQFQQQQQQQPQQFYQPQRPDNASIMALYNYSQTTPQQSGAPQAAQQPALPPTIPENQAVHSSASSVAPAPQSHGVPQPLSPTNNPFMNNATPTTTTTTTKTADPFAARSRESMNLGMDLAWTNGRHSPDAFASLSARHV
ncbi:Protein gts1 [Neonectria magnoliae]|uniref:Protein gts1 n=1 Tax=Neonectria magnoliae TaxID=2732573 RepID=A0ABR1IDL5_9HYPO